MVSRASGQKNCLDNGYGQSQVKGNQELLQSSGEFRTDERGGNAVSAKIILLDEQKK
jgi:hypothetical protein